jgi:acetyl esterase
MGGKPIETLTPAEARQQPTPADAVMSILKKKGKDTSPTALVPGVTSVDREITGAAGNIPARIYTPDGPGPFPVIVYYHGGGWVIADKQVYDGGARGLAKQANAIVVSRPTSGRPRMRPASTVIRSAWRSRARAQAATWPFRPRWRCAMPGW